MIRTKIVATMGPAVSSVDVLLRLFEAGADVCRLNFSHGSLDEHAIQLGRIREASQKFEHPIAILGDLCGPKIRLGEVADISGTGGMPIDVGDELIIQRQPIVGRDQRVSSTLPHLVDDIKIGDRILVEDGALRFVCTKKLPDELHCTTTIGGVLKTAKGINLPNTAVNVPSITDRDWECVQWAMENDLDYLALSFVRSAGDLQLLREHLNNNGSDIPLVAKIEKAEALKEIDAIIDAADGLMVARGDLGVEIDVAQVPIVQKDLIRRCCAAGKPVIVATQMLQTMIEQASPTRAEVSDVANAIFDGTDAVMLSGETSVGKFPLGAVHVMNHIADTTEAYLAGNHDGREPTMRLKTMPLSGAIAKGVWQIVQELKSPLVVVWSQVGATARIFSKLRLSIPILALSSDLAALRRMSLQYGVLPMQMPVPRAMADLIDGVDKLVREKELAEEGSRIVIVVGAPLGTPGTMNGIVIHTIGEGWRSSNGSESMPLGEAAVKGT
jgi:pyruvate kinase